MTRSLHLLPVVGLALAGACLPCRVQAPLLEPGTGAAMEASVADVPPDTARIVEVRMVTTKEGGAGEFAPREVRVRQGDVVRFRMADGHFLHNVSFASDANDTRGVPLPPDSPFLTSQGQSWQVRIDLPPGRYEFFCVPHAQTGHRGTLVVEP